MKNKKQKIYFEILLHDIRSVQNVASIFRLADCIGTSKIILSGITPGPKDRFGIAREDFNKISLGAENFVTWEKIGEEPQINDEALEEKINKMNLKKTLEYIANFKKQKNSLIIALEQDKKSIDYKKVADKIKKEIIKNKKYLIIPGREVKGLQREILEKVDIIAEISQYGKKESLNIFSSLSVALYRFFDII